MQVSPSNTAAPERAQGQQRVDQQLRRLAKPLTDHTVPPVDRCEEVAEKLIEIADRLNARGQR